jgi:glycosyltransferase involved in cell wall biosynthesis
LAIAAVKQYNQTAAEPYILRIAGKHYAGAKDTYWQERIAPQIDGREIIYDGFVNTDAAKQQLFGNAAAVLMPSMFEEPFGMVAIESLACGTPVIALDSGALPEVVADCKTGFVVTADGQESETVAGLVRAIERIGTIDRRACRAAFEARFTAADMCRSYLDSYKTLVL